MGIMKYKQLAELYSSLEKTSKRLEKTHLMAEFLRALPELNKQELEMYLLMIRGKVFSELENKELGVSDKIVIKALSKCMGMKSDEINDEWKKLGDLGLVAGHLVNFRKQATLFTHDLTVDKVFKNLRKLADTQGKGSIEQKIQLISELLSSADPVSARYITRNVLQDLRVGVANSAMRDAIAWTFLSTNEQYDSESNSISPENRENYNNIINITQAAYDKLNDFSELAEISRKQGLAGLKKVKIRLGFPIKVMLGPKVKDFDEGFKTVGLPCQIEYKYDGFRMQIHKVKDKIRLFTRRLDEVTDQFPDVVNCIKDLVDADEFILDSEAVGYDKESGKYLPFQSISQRIKRKYDIERVAKDYPVELNVFDIIFIDGNDLLNEPFSHRREILEKVAHETKHKLKLARSLKIDNKELAQQFFDESLAAGNEGVMLKKLDAPYKPGSRVGHMVKMKPVMETLDLVITGAEWGNGKRSGWLTSFILSCYDADTDSFIAMGKVGTGIKELDNNVGNATFTQLTDLLKPYIIEENGKEIIVSPKIVVEIEFEEIQKSSSYESGFALRFPRLKVIRYDRSPNDCSTLEQIEEFFRGQNKR